MKKILWVTIMTFLILTPAFSVSSGLEFNALYHSIDRTVHYDNPNYTTQHIKGSELDLRLSVKTLIGYSYGLSFYGGGLKPLSLKVDGSLVDLSGSGWSWYFGANNIFLFDLDYFSQLELTIGYDSAFQTVGHAEARLDTARASLKYNLLDWEGYFFSFGLEYSYPIFGRIIDYQDSDYSTQFLSTGKGSIALLVGIGLQTLW